VAQEKPVILDSIKKALRISHNALDDAEIVPLINAAKKDLETAGVVVVREDDPLIQRAVTAYVKAHFGYDNPEAERFERVYHSIKSTLSLLEEYTTGGGDAGA
jgi:uncharacterized phage protein (predicted DNA packaging)